MSARRKTTLLERCLRLVPAGRRNARIRPAVFRELLACVQPGDVLVRRIGGLRGFAIPGYFGDAALYLGEVRIEDFALLQPEARDRRRADGSPVFRTGRQLVIHATSEGVELQDLRAFCGGGALAVLRLARCMRLGAGETVTREAAIPVVCAEALAQVGAPYDFRSQFGPGRLERLACTELVCAVLRVLQDFHQVRPRRERLFGLVERSFIRPDAFMASPLELVWCSPSVDAAAVAALRRGRHAGGAQPAPAGPRRPARDALP